MNGGLNWARREVASLHLAAQGVWRDSTASHYRLRVHSGVVQVLDRYFLALKGLDDAVDEAERVAAGIG